MNYQKPLLCLWILAATVLTGAAAGTGAAAVPKQWRTGLARIREEDLRADLAFISSDAALGRMSLEPGDDSAAEWVMAEFKKAGLEPAVKGPGGHADFLQPVPLIEYRPNPQASFIELSRNGSKRIWRAPDVILGFHEDKDVAGPVVFAGYGITARGLAYDDYKNLDARGKIVIVFEHEPQETDAHSRFNGTGNTRYATNRVKALNAQAHGAVAMVVIPEPNRTHPSNLERYLRIGGSAKRAPPLPSQVLAEDELDIPVIAASDPVGAELLASAGESPKFLQAAIDKDLSTQSRALPDTSLTLHLENWSRARGVSYNVAGLVRGSDPRLTAETVMLSAHHDHDGWTVASSGGREIWHGADDNGSGTVGVVELARAFTANAAKPKRSILFVVFAAEERGLLGAYYLAAHPLRPLQTTRAMVNFDMIGRDETPSDQTRDLIVIPADTHNRLNLIGAAYSPDFKKTVVSANRSIGLDLDDRFDHEYALNTFFRSDQFPFVLHDIPAFWFFTGFHPDYHHVTDTAEKINYAKMTKIVKLAYLSVWRFGTDAAVPAFVADPRGD